MTAYEDLTPYSYYPAGVITRGVLNVGWLGGRSSFETADPDPALVEALLLLAHHETTQLMRGMHGCELCVPGAVELRNGHIVMRLDGTEVLLGNGEIRPRGDGVVYSAPTMVAHYVEHHRYRPPAEFVRAALTASARHRQG